MTWSFGWNDQDEHHQQERGIQKPEAMTKFVRASSQPPIGEL